MQKYNYIAAEYCNSNNKIYYTIPKNIVLKKIENLFYSANKNYTHTKPDIKFSIKTAYKYPIYPIVFSFSVFAIIHFNLYNIIQFNIIEHMDKELFDIFKKCWTNTTLYKHHLDKLKLSNDNVTYDNIKNITTIYSIL